MKYILLLGLLVATPLQAQMDEAEFTIVHEFCDIGPPIVCQINSNDVVSPRTARELEIAVLDVVMNNPKCCQELDSLLGEIIWRVEYIGEVNVKYGGDPTSIDILIARLNRIREHTRREHASIVGTKLWVRKWNDRSIDALMPFDFRAYLQESQSVK